MAMKPKSKMKMLKALAPCCFVAVLLLNVQFVSGQTGAVADSTGYKTPWYHAIRLRIPEFILDYVHPFRERLFSSLPNGLDKYMYPVHNGGAFFAPFSSNYRFRWVGLFYKDRIG